MRLSPAYTEKREIKRLKRATQRDKARAPLTQLGLTPPHVTEPTRPRLAILFRPPHKQLIGIPQTMRPEKGQIRFTRRTFDPQISALIRLLKRAETKATLQIHIAALHAGKRVRVITANAATPLTLRV